MTTTAALSPTLRADVRELLATTTAHDGVSPLDEAAILALEGERAHHILREQDAADGTARLLVGYTNVLADGTVQGMVHPSHRRRGHGTELLREAQAMIDQPLDPAELAGARNAELLSLPNRFETNSDIGASLAEAFVFDLPLDYYNALPARLAAVTADDVQRVARTFIQPERLSIVLVGNAAAFREQLVKAGIGSFETIPLAEIDLSAASLRKR